MSKRKRDALHAQLRKEIEQMRSGVEMDEQPKTTARRERRAPTQRRFAPVMPKGYVSADDLRAELQARVSGTPQAARAEATDLIPTNTWWND